MTRSEGKPGPRRLSRRAFIRLVTLAGIGATYAVGDRALQPLGAWNVLRWEARATSKRLLDQPSLVGLASCSSYDADLLDCLVGLWQQAAMPDLAGKRVLIKPNLIDAVDGHPVTTAPAMVGATVDLVRRLGAGEVIVGEGPGFRRDAWAVAEETGLSPVLAARKVAFIDLNYDDPRPVPAQDGWFLNTSSLWLPRHVREADLIISLPKLKTHHWAGVSLSLKNLFGLIPGVRYGWPKNLLHVNPLDLSILGIYQTVRKVVSIVDGVIGMEGDGPMFGDPVAHGLVAAGRDPLSVDITCARLMGYSVDEVGHLSLAAANGVGHASRIETRGGVAAGLQRSYRRPPAG